MSLISNLHQIIKDKNGGIFTQNELEDYCKTAQYKLSNAERRLRPSESPNIERVMKNGAIVGYRWSQYSYTKSPKPSSPIVQYRTCCYSFKVFQTHDPHCLTLKQTTNQLF